MEDPSVGHIECRKMETPAFSTGTSCCSRWWSRDVLGALNIGKQCLHSNSLRTSYPTGAQVLSQLRKKSNQSSIHIQYMSKPQ